MLLTKLQKIYPSIIKYKTGIKYIISLLGTTFLFFIRPKEFKIFSDQSLNEFISTEKNLFADYNHMSEFNYNKMELKLGDGSPWETIKINVCFEDLKQVLSIYNTLKSMKCISKCIIFSFDFEHFLSKFKKIIKEKAPSEFNYLMSHSIKVMRKRFRDNRCHYFCVMNIKFRSKSYVKINFLQLPPKNSDLLFLACHFFEYSLNYFNYIPSYNISHVLTLDLSIQRSFKEMSKLSTLIRCISNMHSHSLGSYFYLMLKKEKYLSIINFIPIFLSNLIYLSISSVENGNVFSVCSCIIFTLLFYIFPPVFILIFYYNRNNPLNLAFFSVLMIPIQCEIALIFNIFLTLKNALEVLLIDKKYKRNYKKKKN